MDIIVACVIQATETKIATLGRALLAAICGLLIMVVTRYITAVPLEQAHICLLLMETGNYNISLVVCAMRAGEKTILAGSAQSVLLVPIRWVELEAVAINVLGGCILKLRDLGGVLFVLKGALCLIGRFARGVAWAQSMLMSARTHATHVLRVCLGPHTGR